MVLWPSWQLDILPHVPQCPVPLIEHELKRAAQVFFQESRAWQEQLTPITIFAGFSEVTIPMNGTDQELVRVESARWNGKPIEPRAADDMDQSYTDDWRDHSGPPEAFIQITPGVMTLYPVPTEAGTLSLRVSVRPSESATGIPDDLAARFRDQLAMGAKARLMLYQGKPWSAPDMGLALSGAFASSIEKAASAMARSYSNGRVKSRASWC